MAMEIGKASDGTGLAGKLYKDKVDALKEAFGPSFKLTKEVKKGLETDADATAKSIIEYLQEKAEVDGTSIV